MSEATDDVPVWLPPEAQGTNVVRARLRGRKILVVGAGTQPSDESDPPPGNGRAIALLCAREGAAVACADKNEASARNTQSQIIAAGDMAYVLVADVTDEHACEAL